MFITTKAMVRTKLKNFFNLLAGGLISGLVFFVLLLIGVNDDFCNIIAELVGIVALLAVTVIAWFYFATKHNLFK